MADKFDVSDIPDIGTPVVQTTQVHDPAALAASMAPEDVGLTEQDIADVGRNLEAEKVYGDRPLAASAMAAADTASFSLAGRILKRLGIVTQEDLHELAKRNPEADLAGTIAGIVAPAIATGGASAGAQGTAKAAASTAAKTIAAPVMAASKAGATVEKIVASALAKSGTKSTAKQLLKDSLAKAAGGATEGAAFGAGQLLREDSLGDAELNAENLLSAAGTGALYGGLVGASIPSIGAGVGLAGKGTGKIFDKIATKYADSRKAAQEYTGLSLSKLQKLESNPAGKDLLDNLPGWYKDEVGLTVGDSAEAFVQKLQGVKNTSGAAIDDIVQRADELAKTRISVQSNSPSLRHDLLNGIADDIEREFYLPNSGYKSLAPQNRRVKNLIDDIRTQAAKREGLTGESLIDIKRKVDMISKNFYDRAPGAPPKLSETAAYKARDLINKASQKYVDFVDPHLAQDLMRANKNYHYAKTVLPSLEKKILKDKDFLGFQDALYGTLGYGFGQAPGLALLAGKKFLESDFRRKLAILSGIKNNSNAVSKVINESLEGFFSKTSKPSRLTAIAALINSPLSTTDKDGRKFAPKNRKEAYAKMSENLGHYTAEPDKLLERTVRSGAGLSYGAPATAEAVGVKLISAVQFLQSKIPKRPYEAELPGMQPKPYEPSTMELAKFERYIQAIESPLSVLQDFQSNALTRDHIDAIKAVYPKLYQSIREAAYDKMREHTDRILSYQKRVQLSLLLDLDGDSSLIGKNIAALQQNFMVQEQPEGGAEPIVEPTQGGAENINQAQRTASETQAFMHRRSTGE